MIRFVCRPFPLSVIPASFPPFTPLHRRCSEYFILDFKTCFLFSLLLPFPLGPPRPYPCCGLSCLHSAFPGFLAATLPTYLHAGCGNRGAITLFLCFSSRLLAQHLPHTGCSSRKDFSSFFYSCFILFQQTFFSDHKSSDDRE